MATATEHSRAYRARKRKIFQDFKAERGCSCGQRHPAALDLHHREGEKKHPTLIPRAGKRSGWDTLSIRDIKAELPKCDVLCANCHRILHWDAAANEGDDQ